LVAQENVQSCLGELILIGGDNFRLLVGGGVISWTIVLLIAMYLVLKSFLAILYGWLKKNQTIVDTFS
jgi:hypothetical protein